jgi:putative membrane-bound dehydrogenase-like protein
VPEGFQVELILQAPDIQSPTALCVAPNGDVYFAEDPMDMTGPPTENLDRVWLLKGGDPKKKVLFADHLWAVMGLELVRDKLYVVHAPYVSVFTLDKDGKAAKRQDLFTDLGPPVAGVPSFNDHIPSGIRMGMDGWLYVSIGDKGIPKMTRKEVGEGSVHVAEGRWRHTKEGHHISLEGGGVIRFRADGSGLEVFASGTRNHLDVPMDEHDRIIVRDNTDDGLGWWTRLMYLPRGGFMGYPWAYTKHPGETLPMVRDFGGGSPCGGWVYCDDGLPETYRGRVFHCEWGQGKVLAVKLAADGTGFKSVDQITFMDPKGAVKDFRPFTLRPTADGRGFYVTDWAFSGWLEKKQVGRLWKVTYTKDDVKPAPRGQGLDSVEQLIQVLDHPAHSERLRAQRILATRSHRQVVATLTALIKGKKLSARALPHALWALREVDPAEAYRVSHRLLDVEKGADPAVRLEALRVMSEGTFDDLRGSGLYKGAWGIPIRSQVYELLTETLDKESDARIRMQAANVLRLFRGAVPGASDFERLEREEDRLVRSTLLWFLASEVSGWTTVQRESLVTWAKTASDRGVEGMLQALSHAYDANAVLFLARLSRELSPNGRRKSVETLARLYKDRKPYAGGWWGTQPAGRKPPARDVAGEQTPYVRDAVLAALKDADTSVRQAAVAALVEMNDPDTLDPIVKQFGTEKVPATRADLVKAASGLAGPQSLEFLSAVLGDGRNPEAVRLEAIPGLRRADTAAAAAALAKATAPAEPVVVRVRALEALGAMKAADVQVAAKVALKSPEPAVRKAAIGALASHKGPYAPLLVPLLNDQAPEVREATARALGALEDRVAVPALVQSAGDEKTQFEAVSALTRMPDRRALTSYLTGLASKNVELRKASAAALASIREQTLPDLEQLVRRNEVRTDLLPELRSIYSNFVSVLEWKVVGPFPDDNMPHPPEKEQLFDATYRSFDHDVRWKPMHADGKNHGFVDLSKKYRPNDNVVAYAYAEVTSDASRDATLQLGSDDTIAVWVNGKQVHAFDGSRAWSFDHTNVTVHLDKGTNRLLVRCGNHSGPWGFSVAVSGDAGRYAFLQGGTQKFDLETFRDFARKNAGDASRGKKLFQDLKGLACIKCHAVAGEGGRVGPDLAGIGLKYKREDLMTSVLEPSKTIAQGYETVVLTLSSGKTLIGVFKGESAEAVNLADAEGKAQTIAKKDIDERFFSPISTMPNGLSDGMTLQDFADLIAFLEARREETAPVKK